MKKVKLTLLLILTMLLFTGCGAVVHTKIDLNNDSSGTRTTFITIKNSDESSLEGGFEALESILSASIPKGLELVRDNNNNNSTVFSFSYSFINIDDYNDKTQNFFNCEANAIFKAETTPLKQEISFYEANNNSSLISWAINAVNESNIISGYSISDSYEFGTNYIIFNNEEVFSSSYDDFNFELITGPKLISSQIFSDFDMVGNYKKKFIITFDEDDYKTLEKEQVRIYLNKKYDGWQSDDDGYSFFLEFNAPEEFSTFIENLSTDSEEQSKYGFQYIFDNTSIFGYKFLVKENYTLDNFFNNFVLSNMDNVIYYYAVPDYEYSNNYYDHDTDLNEEFINTEYKYRTSHRYYDDPNTYFEASNNVLINEVNLEYVFDKKMRCEAITEIIFDKNKCDISEASVIEQFAGKEELTQYKEDGDVVSLTFNKRLEKEHDLNNAILFNKNKLLGSKGFKPAYNIDLFYHLENYIKPEYFYYGYINYIIKIPEVIKLNNLNIDYKVISGEKLSDTLSNQYYIVEGNKSASDVLIISLSYEETKFVYLIYLTVMILVLVFATIIIKFIYDKRKITSNATEQI